MRLEDWIVKAVNTVMAGMAHKIIIGQDDKAIEVSDCGNVIRIDMPKKVIEEKY